MNTIKLTLYISLFIQIVTLIISLIAQFTPVSQEKQLLKEIMMMENVVQLIEFIFYISITLFVANMIDTDIAQFRYYDWVITTPIMLLTTMMFFIYNSKCKTQDRENKKLSFLNIVKDEKESIIKIFLSNFGMLLVGFLQEIGMMNILYSTILGFGCLDYSFYKLYSYVGDNESTILFWSMFILWSIYGFAAMAKNKVKNSMYNVLDIFAKNFYGLFIAYKLLF